MRWLALIALVACGTPPTPSRVAPAGKVVASNVLRGDYAGSPACSDCHSELYEAWSHSPMRNMTRDAATATIRAPFDGATLSVGGDTATMEMQGVSRYIRVATAKGTSRFRITKVIGGRYREDFVGIDESGIGVERVMPATYVFATQSWRYKGYSVMVKERPGLSTRAVWANDCVPCHNTLPLATMLYDEIYGDGLPSYQGKLSDRVLPQSRLWTTRSRDDSALASALQDEIRFLGGEQPENPSLRATLPAAATASQVYLDDKKLVEIGIGCEACHNGSKTHAADPTVMPSFAVESPLIAMQPPDGKTATRAQWINRTCAKCHTVLFTRYPWTWEGGERKRNPGGSTTNSGEGRDFLLGGCASQMSCATCHDPHAEDKRAALDALATPAGNKVCVGCHPAFATEAAQLKHSHHAKGSAGTSCIGCHMPRKNMGLDYELVRYHRIGSPTDKQRVQGDRPLECALCHADKSVASLVGNLREWYGKRYDAGALRALYGDNLDVNTLDATLALGKPHEQAVAIAVRGERRDAKAVPRLVPHLAHAYPLVRFYAHRALEKILGRAIAIDLNATASVIRAELATTPIDAR